MFSRVSFDDLASLLALIAFLLTAGAFVFLVVRAFRMPKRKREHMANLPLEDETRIPEDADHRDPSAAGQSSASPARSDDEKDRPDA